MTVVWHQKAEDDVAEFFLRSSDRGQLQRAVNEVDWLLAVKPEAKGKQLYAGQLASELIDMLMERVGVIPESIRQVQLGPVQAYFTYDALDCIVRILHVEMRS
ncbi:MAG TPA: hypothetical protein VM510_16545 [Caulifigura sp.]|nr:hypothetical protein [Caulifigura sp.]